MVERSPQFNPTSWTVVIAAADSQSPEAEEAMAAIYSAYWHPLYFFARRQGQGPEAAADLIQGFFLKIIETGFLKSADQTRGRFRTFLLTAMKRYMINEWQAANAQKRGGAAIHVSLDFEHAEALFALAPRSVAGAEQDFDRSWALGLLNKATQALESSYRSRDRGTLFEALRPFLPGMTEIESQEDVAARLNVPITTIRSDIHRLRQRFKEALRSAVGETVESGDHIDEEIRYLISVLSSEDHPPTEVGG